MDLKLKDKKVVITGGAKGIGAAVVKSFAAEGAIPIILGRNPQEAKDLISEIGTGHSYHVELTELDEIQNTANKISTEIGPIDILINNAGVNDGASIENGPSTFVHSLEKNLIHPFALLHHFLNDLKSTKGNVINIGSKVAVTGQGGTSGYAASKGGINALTREWALDLAQYEIRVNCVVPAEVMTPLYENWLAKNPEPLKAKEAIESIIPLGQRFTEAEEIADMVVFLASVKSAHTTGQIIYPDGGYTHFDRAYKGKKNES
ncbi:MAG: SDR family oxidoreductase [Verrucomicrobiales bacterium]|nr:SDR family oxidoreductase [Verrucomicrobiota bacterium]MED6298556.1 SDR family oxidoreductase [Verrucomicrobiota bacterium]NRB45594.1 SDR family oxidoreductase [Verrucomicrobiales bacterium]